MTSRHAIGGEHANETYKITAGPNGPDPELALVYTKKNLLFIARKCHAAEAFSNCTVN